MRHGMRAFVSRRWVPLGAGAVLAIGLVVTARVPEAGAGWRVAFIAIHLAGSAGLFAYLRKATVSMRQLLGVAVVLRLLALPMLPTLSDDGYRYLWDGLVVNEANVSPYDHRPSDPALADWQSELVFEAMNSPEYYSVYPPASQAVFRLSALGYRTGGWEASWWLLKLVLVLAEGVGIGALARRVGATRAAYYAWSPLAVVEIAGQGHTEALVIAGLGAALWVGTPRVPWTSLGVTVAGLTKLYPFALLPMAWRRDGWRGLVSTIGLGVVLTTPAWSPDAWSHVRESLGLFLGTLDAFAAPYRGLKALLYPIAGETAGRWASGVLTAVFASVAGVALLLDDGTRRAAEASLVLVVVGFTLTATTLHPWYWLPMLLIYPLLDQRWIWWICSVAPLGYLAYVVPEADLLVLAIGWGGAAVLAWKDRPMQTASALRPWGDFREHGRGRRG